MRQTKIVCTVGPAIDDINKLTQVVEAGADVFRLNFSHGSLDEHRRRVDMCRSVERDIGKPVAILQDLPDPKKELAPSKMILLICRLVNGLS